MSTEKLCGIAEEQRVTRMIIDDYLNHIHVTNLSDFHIARNICDLGFISTEDASQKV